MSGYLGSFIIDDPCTFYANSHTPSTGAAVDADAVPGYRIYEDETGTPLLTGSMAVLDDANTVGFYSEQITLSAANGFEAGKSYCLRITLVVGGVTGIQLQTLQIGARVDMRMLGGGVQSATDLKDFADDGYDPSTNKVQGVVVTDTVTTYTGNTVQTGDSFARIGATGSGLTSLATQASVNTIDDFLDTEVAAILAAVDTEVAAIKAVTDLLPDAGALTSLATAAALDTVDNFLDTEVAAILAAVDTEVAAILALLDNARGEPGQGAPPVNPDMATKVDWIYKAFRNKTTQTATQYSLYADDGTTIDTKASLSDDGTTATRGELATGP